MAPPTLLSIREEEKFSSLHVNRFDQYEIRLGFRSSSGKFSSTVFENFPFSQFLDSSLWNSRPRVFPTVTRLVFGQYPFESMKYLCIIAPAVLAVIFSIESKKVAAQPVCSSAYLDNPQNRRLCATLANFFGLPNTLEAYPEEIRPNFGYGLPIGYKGRIPAPDFIENMPGTKRQDVDHVFLRFGRRR